MYSTKITFDLKLVLGQLMEAVYWYFSFFVLIVSNCIELTSSKNLQNFVLQLLYTIFIIDDINFEGLLSMITQVKEYRPVPAETHRKSLEYESSIPAGNFPDFSRWFSVDSCRKAQEVDRNLAEKSGRFPARIIDLGECHSRTFRTGGFYEQTTSTAIGLS